jgi:transposase
LLQLVAVNKPSPIYEATRIATVFDHLVYFTPPYHPTLQPIELVWALVKGGIARRPAKNANDLVSRVLAGLEENKGVWLKVFRHVQGNEDAFVNDALVRAE